jgi:hypothetical protein
MPTGSLVLGRVASLPLTTVNSTEKLLFLHIGKCGGTFIDSWLHTERVPFTEAHMWRPSVDDRVYSRYIVWVRDPVERFRSASTIRGQSSRPTPPA